MFLSVISGIMGDRHPPKDPDIPAIVSSLVKASETDTLFRDLYLDHAREYLASLFSYERYLGRIREIASVERLVREIHTAVEREDWVAVRDIAGRHRALRQSWDGTQPLLELARQVYDPLEVRINPFMPSLHGGAHAFGDRPVQICERLIRELAFLEEEDAAWRDFYAGRRVQYEALSGSIGGDVSSENRFDPSTARLEALGALDIGNLELLETLANKVLDCRDTLPPDDSPEEISFESRCDLSAPFPGISVEKARSFGMSPARLSTNPVVDRHIRLLAKHPPVGQGTVAGSPAMMSVLEFISSCPMITSGGTRYRPALVEEEVLVEDFPEIEAVPPSSRLLVTLGIPRRKAVSRMFIDKALLRNGVPFLRDGLGLDPQEFRVVCIPPDVYARVGISLQWGRTERLWTHFDGYQVGKEGALLALVGGDARFGGVYDLCSIQRDDEREGVILRLAVVRRQRLFTRYL